jgi:hypothetical protein
MSASPPNAHDLLAIPEPVLFNTWKHHAGALRLRVAELAQAGPAALPEAVKHIVVLGGGLMDLYTGALWPVGICAKVVELLREEGTLEPEAYRAWLAGREDHAVFTFSEDDSRWVVRLGDEQGRYVHLHPGRWSPATVRVRANVLKTAFLVLLHVAVHGGDALDRTLINAVRGEHLGLSPLGRDPEGEGGLGAAIDLLRRAAPR